MSDIDRIIEEDKKKHPKCGYSKQFSRECKSINGKMKCEEIQRIFRTCPGKRPVELHRVETKDEDSYIQEDYEDDYSMEDRNVDFDMESEFQNQLMGMMQLANLMMNNPFGSSVSEYMQGNEGEEDWDEVQSSTHQFDDRGPIPYTTNAMEDPSIGATSFTAPHKAAQPNKIRRTSKDGIRRIDVDAAPHHFSDYEDKGKEF